MPIAYKTAGRKASVCLGIIAACFGFVSAQNENVPPLLPGKAVERQLSGGERHAYALTLEAGQYLHLVVEQKGVDVVVTLFDPRSQKLAEVDSPNGTQGPEPLSIITDTAGLYRLEVSSLEKNAPAGLYEARIVELRASIESDKKRVAGAKADLEGQLLENEGTSESRVSDLSVGRDKARFRLQREGAGIVSRNGRP
jgi:hypothetical protein